MRLTCSSTRLLVGTIAIVWLGSGCADSGLTPSNVGLSLGTWGGDNAAVIATDSVTHVHVGCTYGDIPGRVSLDRSGRFTLDGSYLLKAYPIAVGPRLPARFSGRVVGRTLTLSVSVDDTTAGKVVPLGPVVVYFGQAPAMGGCPICRVPRMPPAAESPPNPLILGLPAPAR